MKDLRRTINIDFEKLLEKGVIIEEFIFETEGEALEAYKDIHEHLALSREVAFADSGESFNFSLNITINPPFKITVQIYLV